MSEAVVAGLLSGLLVGVLAALVSLHVARQDRALVQRQLMMSEEHWRTEQAEQRKARFAAERRAAYGNFRSVVQDLVGKWYDRAIVLVQVANGKATADQVPPLFGPGPMNQAMFEIRLLSPGMFEPAQSVLALAGVLWVAASLGGRSGEYIENALQQYEEALPAFEQAARADLGIRESP